MLHHRIMPWQASYLQLSRNIDLLVSVSAEEARKIEQFIAKNIDGGMSDFSLFYRNITDSSLEIDAFFIGTHRVAFRTEKRFFNFEEYADPALVYSISPGIYFINYDIFQELEIRNQIQQQKNSVIASWYISYQEKEPSQIYLSENKKKRNRLTGYIQHQATFQILERLIGVEKIV